MKNPGCGTLMYISDTLAGPKDTYSAVATEGLLTTVDFRKLLTLPGSLSMLSAPLQQNSLPTATQLCLLHQHYMTVRIVVDGSIYWIC